MRILLTECTLWPWTECTVHDDIGLRMLFEMMYCPPDFGSQNHGIGLHHQTMFVYGDCLLCHILSQCAKGPSVETRYDVLEYDRLPALLRDRGYRHAQRVAETKRLAWQISFSAYSSDTVCEPFSILKEPTGRVCIPMLSHHLALINIWEQDAWGGSALLRKFVLTGNTIESCVLKPILVSLYRCHFVYGTQNFTEHAPDTLPFPYRP
jgi:hypothetical protein